MSERDAIVAWLRHDLHDWPDYVAPSDIADAIECGDHLPASVAGGDAIVAVTAADREAMERLDDALGFLMDDERAIVLQALADHRATHAGDVERLREALETIRKEAERENGGWVHLKRVIAIAARQALEASR